MIKNLNIHTKDRISGVPFDCFIKTTPISDVRTIKLLSVELPLCWYNVRPNMNEFKYSIYDSFDVLIDTYTIQVMSGTYTALLLCSALQTAINNQIVGTTSTVSSSDITNRISITLTNDYQIEIHETNLTKYILGFSNGQKNKTITGIKNYNMNHDLYIALQFSGVQSAYVNHPMTFKIPITKNLGTIQNLQVNDWFEQIVNVENQTNLSSFKLQVSDQYGYKLDNNGCDFSLTIQLT